MAEKVVWNASDFKYPSSDEIKLAHENYPKIKNFGFLSIKSLQEILIEGRKIEEVSREESLNIWDLCLLNRFGKLYTSYINAIANFNRGISDTNKSSESKNGINEFQFHFYAEVFYYYFFLPEI